MTKFYLRDENETDPEYVYKHGNKCSLKRTKSQMWNTHFKGKKVIELKRVGDDIKISHEKYDLTLDASEICELYYLLRLFRDNEDNLTSDMVVSKKEEISRI